MRLIDAEALISFIDMGHLRNPLEACYSERDVVDMLESRPVLTLDDLRPRGQWVNNKDGYPECDQCGYMPQYDPMIDDIYYSPFCPSCGAKMDLEDADGQD